MKNIMNPLRKAAALALLLPAAALIALTGAASATAENLTGDLDTEGPTDRAYEEPDMAAVAPADPPRCPEGNRARAAYKATNYAEGDNT